jgi:hypothetical protein
MSWFDECVGYFGAPGRALRHFAESEPTRTHTLPLAYAMVKPQLFLDLVAELAGELGSYPTYGEGGRRAIETTLGA